MSLVLGVDSSTQSTKVELRRLDDGTVVATGHAAHPPTEPPVSEQDPAAWWTALVRAVEELGEARADVVAMAVGGQQHGLVLLDGAGEAVRPAKLWNDTTSAAQAAALVSSLGAAEWATRCGSVPVPAFTVTKLAWISDQEPEALARTARIMLPHDYLTWRLTGNHVTDRGDASGTGWFDPGSNCYRPDLLATATGDESWVDRLPRVLAPDQAAGAITAAAAAELGLPDGVMVGPGTGDNMAAAVGLGLRPGDVALSLGTSGTVYAVTESAVADETGAVAGFADANGAFLPLVCTLNATKVTDTVAAWLGTDAAGLGSLALSAEPGSAPVLVPYFDGERTPNLPHASGLLTGLRTSTTREQVALAAHDGVLCGLLDGLDALHRAGVAADGRLHLIGGGARSDAYRQRAADLHGAPIVVPNTDETVATGAAVQAAAVHSGRAMVDIGTDWKLGVGLTVDPVVDGSSVRAHYAQARSLARS